MWMLLLIQYTAILTREGRGSLFLMQNDSNFERMRSGAFPFPALSPFPEMVREVRRDC
jgi:hypothetical protein